MLRKDHQDLLSQQDPIMALSERFVRIYERELGIGEVIDDDNGNGMQCAIGED